LNWLVCDLGRSELTRTAATYDESLASAINAEFRELLTLELEKVDDRFFAVQHSAEEEVDELDATVYAHPNETYSSGTMASQRRNRTNGMQLIPIATFTCERRKKCLRVTRTLEDLLGNAHIAMRLNWQNLRRRMSPDSRKSSRSLINTLGWPQNAISLIDCLDPSLLVCLLKRWPKVLRRLRSSVTRLLRPCRFLCLRKRQPCQPPRFIVDTVYPRKANLSGQLSSVTNS
jgi:hypothetical protein